MLSKRQDKTMATYQEFKDDLIAKLATTTDAELVTMVNALIDYTDALIEAHIAPAIPPILPNLNMGSRGMPPSTGDFASADPPQLPDLHQGSKVTGQNV